MKFETISTGLALVLATWLVELVVLKAALGRKFELRQYQDLFLINLLTNPAANTVYYSGYCNFIETELLVIVAESWPIARSLQLSIGKGLVFSLLANSTSAMLGFVIFYLFETF